MQNVIVGNDTQLRDGFVLTDAETWPRHLCTHKYSMEHRTNRVVCSWEIVGSVPERQVFVQ